MPNEKYYAYTVLHGEKWYKQNNGSLLKEKDNVKIYKEEETALYFNKRKKKYERRVKKEYLFQPLGLLVEHVQN